MKNYTIIGGLLIGLSACAFHPAKTLDQNLAEAPADRKEKLRLACLNEAEWPAGLQNVRTVGRRGMRQRQKLRRSAEVTEMKSLCLRMDDLTAADAEQKLPSNDPANACAAIVDEKKQKDGKGRAEHADRIAYICKEMIYRTQLIFR